MKWIACINTREAGKKAAAVPGKGPPAAIGLRKWLLPIVTAFIMFSGLSLCRAQAPGQVPPPPSPEPEKPVAVPNGYTIERDVNLVVLHVSVLDEAGQFVPGLLQGNFRIF